MNYRDLYEFLSYYLNDSRKELLEQKVNHRTTYITIIVEDVFQPQNINALIRTCECLGVHQIHVVEVRNKFEIHRDISMGAAKWIEIKKYKSIEKCVEKLRSEGYDIVATTPAEESINLGEVKLDKKIALMFGTELTGLTEKAISLADYSMKIPMYGFTESYNISVSAAICLYHLNEKLRNSNINYKLSEEKKYEILVNWAEKSLRKPKLLIQEFLNKKMSEA